MIRKCQGYVFYQCLSELKTKSTSSQSLSTQPPWILLVIVITSEGAANAVQAHEALRLESDCRKLAVLLGVLMSKQEMEAMSLYSAFYLALLVFQ